MTMIKNVKKPRSMALYEAILNLKNMDECCRFFDDLCTPGEQRNLAIEAASKVVGANLDDEKNRRLVDQFLSEQSTEEGDK